MPQVSKNKLKLKVKKDITSQFINTIAQLDKKSADIFFNQFFTKTERLMFAKRLAIIYLLKEGFSSYRISRLLKVSKSTVSNLSSKYTPLEKKTIISTCERLDVDGGLLRELKDLLLNGFSMDGKKRSKWLNEYEKKYQR